ncbi:MAG: glycosyltransferase family 2 protein [Kiritimatiellae bacterium]|jgi:glycosyltransferase involved in cell wall biosynthesis|nr:glycosyltransferase family 2 protein [Kiritimatiellia bacterium]
MSQTKKINLSIVIPVYNSVDSLQEIVCRCETTFEEHAIKSYEVIFVDDASPNVEVWSMIERLALQHEEVKGIQLSRNFGQQAATLCGFRRAEGQYVLTMDDDLQHRPEDIPALWKVREDADIVIGEYADKKQHAWWRNVCSWIKGYLDYKLIDKPHHIALSPFRLISRLIVDGILDQKPIYPFIPAMMFCITQRVIGVPVAHEARKYGASTYSIRKMFQMFSNLLINNSSYLLQIMGRCGIAVACFAVLFGLSVLIRKIFFGIEAVGWASIFLATCFLGGLNLLAVSVVGEYLIRIVRTVENKPQYCVRKSIGN